MELTARDTHTSIGSELVFDITVTNQGPDIATSLSLASILPANSLYVSGEASQGIIGLYGNEIIADFGTLCLCYTTTATITLTPTEIGLLTVEGTAAANEFDPVPQDNTSSASVQVALGDGPDLLGAETQITKRCSSNGSCRAIIQMRVPNRGNAIAGKSTTSFYLSDDNVLTPGVDLLLKSSKLGKVKPGKSRKLGRSLNAEGPLTGKYIFVVLDSGDAVAEGSEYNNHIRFGPLE